MENKNVPVGGIVLIVAGALIALRAFGIINFGFWFWVGAIIMVPCIVGLVRRPHNVTGNVIGIVIGALMMLRSLGVLPGGVVFPLIVAAALLCAGIKVIVGRQEQEQNRDNGSYKNTTSRVEYDENGNPRTVYSDATFTNEFKNSHTSSEKGSANGSHYYTAILSGRDITFAGEQFDGAILKSVLGGIELNLRNAILTGDTVINATVVLGGIDIYVPQDVNVIVNCNPVLGGVQNSTQMPVGTVNCKTLTINATCVLGGIEVKY